MSISRLLAIAGLVGLLAAAAFTIHSAVTTAQVVPVASTRIEWVSPHTLEVHERLEAARDRYIIADNSTVTTGGGRENIAERTQEMGERSKAVTRNAPPAIKLEPPMFPGRPY